MRPMRVCMLSVHTCPLATLGGKETGGMNVYVRDLTRELSRRGVLVDVFTRSQDPCRQHVVSDRLGAHGRVIHVKAGPEAPYDKQRLPELLPEFTANVERFAADAGIHYDVIHSHYWLSGLVAIELRQRWGAPFVQMFHTLGHMKNSVAQRPEELESERRLQGEAEVMRQADAIVAATPLEKAQMSWLYGAEPAKITVIPCGVDLEQFHPIPRAEAKACLGLPQRQRMILFVGRIEALKGIDTLLRAIALLVARRPEWQSQLSVIILGGNPHLPVEQLDAEMARLHALRAELGISDVVTFRGASAQETLPAYYSAAEMVIVPSHYESFGMVALEAMACGTPVIATKVGGLAYTVQDGVTGFHIPCRDYEALAERMERILSDRALQEQLGRQAAEWAGQYSWSRIAEQILCAYRQVLRPCRLEALSLAADAG
jgi:D-inositol-3-phosphate glycosyltransferase